jgi:hypothetical protein
VLDWRCVPFARLRTRLLAVPTRWRAAGFSLVVALVALIAMVTLPGGMALGSAAPTRDPHLNGASFSETWTTGHLPDTGGPIAFSSPVPVTLGGQASVVVGDRTGNLFAYHLGGSSPAAVPGWPAANESGPIDSTPSIAVAGGQTSVLVGSGNDGDPVPGGYTAYDASGDQKWFTHVVNPPSDSAPAGGVQAGIAVGSLLPGSVDAVAGSLGQVSYALDATTGAPLTGWPFLNSDSTHSTAALADLYGTGQTEIVDGGDQTAGMGNGQEYANGGHLRILSAEGNQICRADTNQVVDSSPAVGGFLAGGATGIVVGTGGFFPGASDTNTLKAYNNRCQLQWSATLDGDTFSSPALSDVLGNGSLQVVEGTDAGVYGGSVWVLDAATGQKIWEVRGINRVIGSVVTADLGGTGYDDVLVPTIAGTLVLDGRTGAEITDLSPNLGLQNSPLVTVDPNGTIGITLAGYVASGQSPAGVGEIDHYEVPGSDGAAAVGGAAWPMFHHDPQLTGNAGGTTAAGSIPPCSVPSAAYAGYNLAAADGGIFTFGTLPFCGSTGGTRLNAPVVGMAMAPGSGGYWEVAADGGVFTFGGAGFFGSMGGTRLNAPIVGMAATPDGGGYWLVAADGGVFAFGDAAFYGSMGGKHLNSPVVGMSSSTDGKGYRLVAADGGIFAFGDAPFAGSEGGARLNAPVVGTANDANTGGYWEVAADGGVFSFGGAPFYGSTGNIHLNAPIVGMAETANGSGYRFAASDGGVFSFSAPFLGSMGAVRLAQPVVAMAGT